MPFCVNCGQEIKEGTKFCTNCGSAVVPHIKPENSERKTFYDGEIRKCPSCGEVINSFMVNCPACGYELRGSTATSSVQRLYWELNRATSVEQKILMIRNYPIPNAKEDIIEFMILASSNIGGEADKGIFEAWAAKFEQAYQKAQMTLQTDTSFAQIEEIYEKTEKAIALEKISHTTATAGNMVKTYFKAMPNPVFAIIAIVLVIFNFMRFFSGEFAGIDIVFDAIILSVAYNLTEKKAKKAKKQSEENPSEFYEDKIKIPPAVNDGTSENYVVIEMMLAQAGFTNIKSVPLNDLTFGVRSKPGTVERITINGKELSTYFRKKFDADVPIVITYHSMRK